MSLLHYTIIQTNSRTGKLIILKQHVQLNAQIHEFYSLSRQLITANKDIYIKDRPSGQYIYFKLTPNNAIQSVKIKSASISFMWIQMKKIPIFGKVKITSPNRNAQITL